MKRKLLVGFATMVMALTMFATTALAAPLTEYDNAGTVTWGKNGGIDELYIKLNEVADLDLTKLASITTVEVTMDTDTYFKPQFVLNSDSNSWEQKEVEFTDGGHLVYDHPVTAGTYKAENTYNNFVIQSGWKNEGKVVVTSVAFLDADKNVVYFTGDESAVVEEDATVEEPTVEETTEDATVEDAEVVEDTATEEAVPQTGVGSLALVYGLGALVSGAALLKKKQR